MRRINPEYAEMVKSATNSCPYFSLQSMKIVDFDIGASHLEIELEKKHLQPFGLVHGGVFSTIIDAAVFWSVYGEVDENAGMTTVDLNVNFLAPAVSGKLIARGRRIKLGKTIGLGAAEVTDEEGRMLAHGTSTVMIMPDLSFSQKGLPPKFL
jgi:uncharacterized protein (TIGR00369 family)